jgi:UDP-N-acetylmuramoyl-tripeptide--D-alanyl-D-alanine ligase
VQSLIVPADAAIRLLAKCAPYVLAPLLRGLVCAGGLRRRRLTGVPVVGVTGSCGKSITKELIAAALSVRYRVSRTPATLNSLHRAAHCLLRAPSRGGACVIEVGLWRPGDVRKSCVRQVQQNELVVP